MTHPGITLVLASRNRHKLREMAAPLVAAQVHLLSAADLPDVPEVEETGTTFAENAALKASRVAQATGHWALGDDSGLEVDALNNAPGVISARFAGENATDRDNNAKLLEQLDAVPEPERTARFVCHLAVSDPQGQIRLRLDGICRGRILREHRGSNGFGYDPLFLIPEYHQTLGQLSPTVKSVLSHRARALQRLLTQWPRMLHSATKVERNSFRSEGNEFRSTTCAHRTPEDSIRPSTPECRPSNWAAIGPPDAKHR